MRRKRGVLLPIECSILKVAVQLYRQGVKEFYGFQIAKEIKDVEGARRLTSFGTLYRALGRLQKQGFLCSRWEESLPTEQNRPRRRYYRIVGESGIEV